METNHNRPPKIFEQILRIIYGSELFNEISGDLEELYQQRLERKGKILATFHYFKDVLLSTRNINLRSPSIAHVGMLKNFWNMGIRHARSKPFNFVFRAFSLLAGFICIQLLVITILYETSYDTFHENYKTICRIGSSYFQDGSRVNYATSPVPLGPFLKNNFPEIANYARLFKHENRLFMYGDKSVNEEHLMAADSGIFNVFTFDFIEGTKEALHKPGSIVISQTLASKLFGDETAHGKVISLAVDRWKFEVTAVFKDFPQNSHLQFTAIIPFNTFQWTDYWGSGHHTYVRFTHADGIEKLKSKLKPHLQNHWGTLNDDQKSGLITSFEPIFQPISEIHLNSSLFDEIYPKSNVIYIYIFFVIAFFMLIVTALNFINISMGTAMLRAKEVGVRKTFGSSNNLIRIQFLLETSFLVLVMGAISFVLSMVMLPWFKSLIGLDIPQELLFSDYYLATLITIVLLIAILGSLHKSVHLSNVKIHHVLFGSDFILASKLSTRSAFVILQYAVSVMAIISTILIADQIKYIEKKNLGFNTANIVVIRMPLVYSHEKLPVFLENLRQETGIQNATNCSFVPGMEMWKDTYKVEIDGAMKEMQLNEIFVDHDFFKTLNVDLLKGRPFDRQHTTDKYDAYIVNQAAIDMFAWEDPISQKIQYVGDPDALNTRNGKVIGLVKNLHFESLHSKVDPFVMRLPYSDDPLSYVYIKLKTDNQPEGIELIKKHYENNIGNYPLDFQFLDNMTDRLYYSERRINKLLNYMTLIMLSISILGIYSLSTLLTIKRKKEMGIRKVLGASIPQIVATFLSVFLKISLIANLIAWPITYLLMTYWLDNFAYHIELGWDKFLLAGSLSLVIVILATLFQAMSISRKNPILVLRNL